ncbi:hypothetical protein IX307_002817 [Bacteroides pyogenes]|uniref:Lipoprotein n=2 Tax=Bacteroides pyogenes TaxID=310300 RepID=W4PDT2_9BACE|nr:hypothetical protein [Bacteroides pyogenes]GAE16435.1 hypothetical protein JCM6292_2863 [Bacteroides pyogenes JCM 6292]MBR8721560.1 hypothetical protein [Bacteroides pyogenes]MBR8726460.1 hypothetical protein [Bacteroides pyogenes]MBR8739799.1 hypothetical protein [Bacteroides pyogenes]MBR8755614.1 hypothetical protein [Bacteroides pyogenes]
MKKHLLLLFSLLATLAVCSGCDKVKDLANVKFQSEAQIDIPVRLNNDTSGDEQITVSLESNPKIKEYIDYLENITVKSVIVSLPDYKGSDATYDLILKIDGSTICKEDNVNLPEMKRQGTTITVAEQAVLKRIEKNLLNNKKINVYGAAESKVGAVTANFTVRCVIKMELTANPL